MFNLIIKYACGNLPEWIWPALAGGAFVVHFFFRALSALPQVKPYAMFIKPISSIVFVVAIFMYGGAGVSAIYAEALKDEQHKVELAVQASNSANIQLQAALASNEHLINGRAYGVHQTIESHRTVINADCNKINASAVADYNRAVKNTATFTNVTVSPAK